MELQEKGREREKGTSGNILCDKFIGSGPVADDGVSPIISNANHQNY